MSSLKKLGKKDGSGQFIPDPDLADAFGILLAGFKLGAVYGFHCNRKNDPKASKQMLKFLESKEGEQMILKIVAGDGPT